MSFLLLSLNLDRNYQQRLCQSFFLENQIILIHNLFCRCSEQNSHQFFNLLVGLHNKAIHRSICGDYHAVSNKQPQMENRRQELRTYCPNILRPGAYVAWWFQANGISNRRPAFAKVNWKKKPRCNIICQIRKSVSKGNPYRVEIHLVFGTKHGLQKPDASFIFPNIPHISTN